MDAPFSPNVAMVTARGSEQALWHERAADLRRQRFGSRVFVRGVVEVSNVCRENCHYCGMRRDNQSLDRYRAQADQIAELLIHHRPESLTDINIQSGEDPKAAREVVLPLVRHLRRETSLGVSVCLGTLAESICDELLAAGASLYIIKFEIADPVRYAELQAPGSLPERLHHIRRLAATGWRVSSGFIAGLPGFRPEEVLAPLQLATELPLHGCSVSPFIPGESTPLATAPAASIDLTLNCMAALRLLRPDWLIPAVSALNLTEAPEGYRRGLRAGANLCTINLTPDDVRGNYLLYKRERVIMSEERILQALEAEGLTVSPTGLGEQWQPNAAPTVLAPA